MDDKILRFRKFVTILYQNRTNPWQIFNAMKETSSPEQWSAWISFSEKINRPISTPILIFVQIVGNCKLSMIRFALVLLSPYKLSSWNINITGTIKHEGCLKGFGNSLLQSYLFLALQVWRHHFQLTFDVSNLWALWVDGSKCENLRKLR